MVFSAHNYEIVIATFQKLERTEYEMIIDREMAERLRAGSLRSYDVVGLQLYMTNWPPYTRTIVHDRRPLRSHRPSHRN
jgi:hypothetical protein